MPVNETGTGGNAMPDQLVESRVAEGVVTIALDRPPANALTADFLFGIEARINGLALDKAVRAVVITGRNGVLSAGMDLKQLPALDLDGEARTVDALNRAFCALYAFPKPLIVAVGGHAIAGGLFFVLAADYRIGALGPARFALSEVRVGVPFPVGPLEIARAELPPAMARKMLLGGDSIGVDEAMAGGLLDETVAADRLMARALEAAGEHAASPPGTYAAIKRQLRKPAVERIERAINETSDPHRRPWFPDGPEPIGRAIARILNRTEG